MKDHKCNVVGCKANAEENCTNNVDKCVNCKGVHVVKANCCEKMPAAIKKAREERRTWKEIAGECRNVLTELQRKLDQVENGGLSTAEAEQKIQEDEQTVKELEVQVESSQMTTVQTSSAGIPETPMTQWFSA